MTDMLRRGGWRRVRHLLLRDVAEQLAEIAGILLVSLAQMFVTSIVSCLIYRVS